MPKPRRCVDAGIDPIVARGPERQVAASALSVEEACESYLEAQRAEVEDRASRRADPAAAARLRLSDHRSSADRRHQGRRSAAGAGADLDDEEPDRGAGAAVHGRRHQLGDPRGHPHRREQSVRESSGCKFAFPLGIHKVDEPPVAAVRAGAGFPRRAARAGGRQGQGDGVRDADRGAGRRHLRRRQGAFRADEVEPRRLAGRAVDHPRHQDGHARMSCR